MKKQKLTSKERVALALDHQETDRIPIATICGEINEPACSEYDAFLREKMGLSLDEFLNSFIDVADVRTRYVGPPLPKGVDVWGVTREPVSFGVGHYMEITGYPLADARDVAAIQAHPFPSTDMYDFSVVPLEIERIQRERERCLITWAGCLFEQAWYMRGFENAFLDMATEPEFFHALMRRVTDCNVAFVKKVLAAGGGKIDLVFTGDDIAGQNGPLMSLEMWERFVKPYQMEVNRAIHDHGAKVVYHSCGQVTEFIPGLIDAGVDILQALQFDAKGMDPKALKQDFGDSLCFAGGVSVQKTLPFGTVEDVREHVTTLIDTLAANGGYILGPAHCVQAGTPVENIHAMFETALNHKSRSQTQ